jgi:hypothetical protein
VKVKATIPQTTIARAGVQSINVGQVGIGPIHIGQLQISNLHMGMSAGQVQMRNFRVTIRIGLSLDWHVGVHIPFDGEVGGGGTINLGSPSITVPLGNVSVPGLQNFSVDIASLNTANVNATANPITNIQLGTAIAEQIQARNVVVPAHDFTIAGLSLGAMNASGIGVPSASTEQVTIARVHGEALPLGGLAMTNIQLPSATAGDIQSGAVDVSGTSSPYLFSADAGILRVTLRVTPSARGQLDQLRISGVNSSASIGRIQLTDVVAPYEMLNVTLGQIGIDTIDVPTLGVS